MERLPKVPFVLLILAVFQATSGNKIHPLSDEFIDLINSKQSTWKAGRNFKREDYELFKTLASGVIRPDINKRIGLKIEHIKDGDIPDEFDAREAWPDCVDIIGLIRDQSRCGSCWAVAAVEAMSDRICIHSKAQKKLLVSAQDLLACGGVGGCDGGWPADAWDVWHDKGIVTGGLYNRTDQGCMSYFLPNCDYHIKECTNYTATPECVQQCDDPSINYTSQKTYGEEGYSILLGTEEQIQLEILQNGPVETVFQVYEDFANYKSGIYKYTSGEAVAGHAVKILGWGSENGLKYWLVANSWNEKWGEDGYFRIVRGVNECEIETVISAGLPDLDRL